MNGSDEHTVGVSSPRLKSPLYCAGAMQGKENCSSPGTNRRQPGGCRQSRWLCWALQFVGWNTACRDIFPPFSLTSLLTLCLFSFSFKIALEKGGGKKKPHKNETFREQMAGRWGRASENRKIKSGVTFIEMLCVVCGFHEWQWSGNKLVDKPAGTRDDPWPWPWDLLPLLVLEMDGIFCF